MTRRTHDIPTLLQQWRAAQRPEDVFGTLETPQRASLKRYYRQLIPLVHPDQHCSQRTEATEAFQLLHLWYEQAQQSIDAGLYGVAPQITLHSDTTRYLGTAAPIEGDLAMLYPAHGAGQQVILKVAHAPSSIDLMQREAQVVRLLNANLRDSKLRAHIPTLVETFAVMDTPSVARRCNVFRYEHDYVRLADVLEAYPNGIDAADAAWMMNRMLATLAAAHQYGLIHGAVVPPHVLLRLSDHNGMLIDWCYSVDIGEPIVAISTPYRAYYPPEVLAKQPASPGTDIYMAAQCMIALLGGNVTTGTVPNTVPAPIAAFLRGCRIATPAYRPQNAWTLLDEFRRVLERLYGPPRFRPFSL